ncbi:MAG: prolyl oligopeptidase family serine peptidase [Bacteroidales bacterium]|nr:prolyl oligopeptidase family serine peptidase [Bacteroidales bacterium]MDD4703618.1 prolyl oligopeptidase family serine peptidase [Bacteroidales bacterium]
MKRLIFLSFFLFVLLNTEIAFSQIEIRKPFMVDSTNNKGEKFNMDNLLQVPSLKELTVENKYEKILFNQTLNMVVKEESFLIKTYVAMIKVNTYTKSRLKLFATDKVKIALDGKTIKERLEIKDSLNDESKISFDLNLEPGSYTLSFTFLVSYENNIHEFRLEQEKGDLLISNNDSKENRTGLTLKTMLTGRNIYSSSISPNGNYVLVKYMDVDDKGKRTYGYNIYNVLGNEPELVCNEEGNSSIKWVGIKDSKEKWSDKLYYLDKKNDNNKLIIQTIDGKKTTFLENLPEGSVSLSSLNNNLIIISQTSKIDNSKEDLTRYLLPDDRIEGWRNRTNLSLYDINTKTLQPLTFGYHSTYLNDYNPSTNSILFSVSYDNITQRPFDKKSIFQINLNTFKVDTIVNQDAFVSYAKYLPNSDKVVVFGSGEAFNSIGNTLKKGVIPNSYHGLLFVLDTKTKEIECITKNFNPSVNSVRITDNGKLFIVAENKDSISVYQYNFDSKSINKIELGLDIVSSFDVDLNGENIVYHGQRYNDFPIVYTSKNIENGISPIKVYKSKSKENLAIGEMKEWNFDYKGTNIEGRYYLPYDFDSTKKYPMIVYYYGGTSPTDRSFEMRYSAYLYTAQGYIVYVLNPSGTTGYGQEFAARHVNAWGERTADEIIFGVKKLCKENSFIDASKIGCMGASYGGFMTMLLQTKTDIFACAISHAGISDITSYWGEGYWGYSYSSGATAHSYPWNRKDIYVERSPLFNAHKINTPILLLHGDSDTNVPIGESIQMFNALKILGKDVEFISVKGENHGIVDFDKRMKWNNTIFAYFAKYLKQENTWWEALFPNTNL